MNSTVHSFEMLAHGNMNLALSGGAIIAIAIGGVLVFVLLWWIGTYNGLVRKKQSCKESWADIDAELKRRHDLIPNLVNTVKGYAAHESDVLSEVTKLRDQAVADQSGSQDSRSKTESMLGQVSESSWLERKPIPTSRPLPTSSSYKRNWQKPKLE